MSTSSHTHTPSSKPAPFAHNERLGFGLVTVLLLAALLLVVNARFNSTENWLPRCDSVAGEVDMSDFGNKPPHFFVGGATAEEAAYTTVVMSGVSHDIQPLADKITALNGSGDHLVDWMVPCEGPPRQ